MLTAAIPVVVQPRKHGEAGAGIPRRGGMVMHGFKTLPFCLWLRVQRITAGCRKPLRPANCVSVICRTGQTGREIWTIRFNDWSSAGAQSAARD